MASQALVVLLLELRETPRLTLGWVSRSHFLVDSESSFTYRLKILCHTLLHAPLHAPLLAPLHAPLHAPWQVKRDPSDLGYAVTKSRETMAWLSGQRSDYDAVNWANKAL